MYSVSNAYKTKMLDQVQTHRLKGTINGIPFTGDDVIGVSYKNQCADKKVNIGSVSIGTLKLTFLTDILNRGEYQNKAITISDGLLIDAENDTWEDIPVGTFYIAEAVWTSAGMVDITAYDCLSMMDKELGFTQTTGKVYDFCQYIQLATGAICGMTEAQCDALPNGTEIISPYAENDMTTYRDLLSGLAEFIGGFAFAGKDGKWYLKDFGDTAVVSIPKNRRVSGAKFSDFATNYDTISWVDLKSDIVKYAGASQGIVMNLGNQPFLQYGLDNIIQQRADAIANAVSNMAYTPFEASLLPAFIALDLGDVIDLTADYAGDTSTGAVMALTWTYNKSVKVYCYGENPNLRTAQSATDKNIAGIVSRSNDKTIRYYTYVNVAAVDDIETEETVGSLIFATNVDTTVTMWHEIEADFTLDDESTPMKAIVHYYLNGVEEPYHPIMTIGESGVHTLDYNYFLQGITGGERNEWLVSMECVGGSADIAVGDVHICLSGQGLVGAESFTGVITASDNMPLFVIHGIGSGAFLDTITVNTHGVADDGFTGSDSLGAFDPSCPPISFTEAVQVYLQRFIFDRITEADDKRVTESGDQRITE